MAQDTARRVALMSIHPQYAHAILDGSKRVEFRKRRLAADIDRVVIYATAPVMEIVGEFTVSGQIVGSPEELWDEFESVAGIDRDGFFEYYANSPEAVGIVVDATIRYDEPQPLDDVDPGGRPPQSVKYLINV